MSSDRGTDSKSVSQIMQTDFESNEITPDKSTKSKISKSSRKRKRRRSSSSIEDGIDSSINESLKQSALRNNLSDQDVKKIITKVVRNDHVLAIVKLKEEKLEREEQASRRSRDAADNERNQSISSNVDDKETDDMDDTENVIPKMTRAKAKALNQCPLPVASIHDVDSEVVALIREELHSDDDDEEYQPGEDDIESDDDINTTTSDIDSQPATPSSQIDITEPRTPIFSDDGLFKVPRARNDSTASQLEQEYSIAKQTRSKISLAETPIEEIESTFKAPDVPSDMYQVETDDDPDWFKFLIDCYTAKPLISASEIEKDEETDPDYNPKMFDGQPYRDREEFQPANVSKKELNDLKDELYEWLIDVPLNGFGDPFAFMTNTAKPSTTDELNDSLVTPVKDLPEPLLTPNTTTDMITEAETTIQASNDHNTSATNYFDPKIISTPARFDPVVSYDYGAYMPYQNTEQIYGQHPYTDPFNHSFSAINETLNQNSYSYPVGLSPYKDMNNSFLIPIVTFPTNPNDVQSNVSPIILPTPAMPSTIVTPKITINYCPPQQTETLVKTQPGCRAKRSRFKGATYKDLEHLDPNTITANQVTFPPNSVGFTEAQRQILERQLRIHVQLSTQTYLQTYGHPKLYTRANKFKKFLLELQEIVDQENSNPVSIFNLKPALELIKKWEMDLEPNNEANTQFIHHVQDELKRFNNNSGYKMKFHHRILDAICKSKVFLYPEFLPPTPLQVDKKRSEYIPSEDYMIAFLLEHFYIELRAKMIQYKFAKPKEVNLYDVCRHISAHLDYWRQPKSVYDYVRLRRKHEILNPIKYYFQHNRAPPYHLKCELFDENRALEPAKLTPTMLPPQFAHHVCKINCAENSKELYRINVASLTRSPNAKNRKTETKRFKCNPTDDLFDLIQPTTSNKTKESLNKSIVQVKILYSEPKCDKNDEDKQLIKGQTLLTSYFKIQPKQSRVEANELQDDFEINHNFNDIEDTPAACGSKVLLFHRKRILQKYNRLSNRKHFMRARLKLFLVYVIRRNKSETAFHWREYIQNKNLLFIYLCILIYHQFTSAVVECEFGVKSLNEEKMSTDAIMISKRVQRTLNDLANNGRETIDENNLVQNLGDPITKRLPKNQRNTNDSNLLMLLSENANEATEKDFLFAQHFMDRVEETFVNENSHHKFTEFLNILRLFNENQCNENGADLYLTLEKLFLPDHPELADLFLLFLTPSDAIEIGKFMDYFFQTNFAKFVSKLNIFFQKQPAQIRKVLTCIKELSEETDVSLDRIRTRILPLLKGNQLLIDWFFQCIGPDKCDGTRDEFETLDLRKSNENADDDAETFEYIPQSEIVSDPNDNPCHIRFINGRLFYGNRITIPAKLSFGVNPCLSPSKNQTEVDKAYLIGARDKTQQYRCVHNIKQFGEQKMRDISKNHVEFDPMGNSVALDDIENSDDEQHHCSSSPVEEKNSFEEDTENAATYGPDQMLCDDALLRAHSIRLNPSSHASIYNNAELLNRLRQPLLNDLATPEACKELKLSPKKQATLKCLTNIIQSKAPPIRKTLSPNSKKTSFSACKSPNGKKTTSPISNQPSTSSSPEEPNSHESNAIQTAKKLKRMLESNNTNVSANQIPEPDETQANKKIKKAQTLVKPIKKQKRVFDDIDQINNTDSNICRNEETVDSKNEYKLSHNETIDDQEDHIIVEENVTEEKCIEEKAITWTSDEDRVLLEQIKNGFDFNTDSITEIAQRFPNKTCDHIRERVDFLIDFILKRT